MNLPRCLSPVRTVEAETGWPRAFCRQFVRHAWATWYGMSLMYGGAVALLAVFLPALWRLFDARNEAPPQRSNAAEFALDAMYILPLFLVMSAVLGAFGQAVGASAARRFLRRYREDPWCFKCKYPIPPPREGRSYSICPECGEPIPPEIATLAAARGDAKG